MSIGSKACCRGRNLPLSLPFSPPEIVRVAALVSFVNSRAKSTTTSRFFAAPDAKICGERRFFPHDHLEEKERKGEEARS